MKTFAAVLQNDANYIFFATAQPVISVSSIQLEIQLSVLEKVCSRDV